jgi:hypothetical protein
MKAELEEVIIKTEGRYSGYFEQTAKDIKACCHAKEVKILCE